MTSGFVGVDWGSSRLRTYLFDGDGRVVDRTARDLAMVDLSAADFAPALDAVLRPWAGRFDRVLLSGMVTSRKGWVETPYLDCPADLSDLPGAVLWRRHEDWSLAFLPGLSCRVGAADVIRGEELQLFGLDRTDAGAVAVLPGTHSKWVSIAGGQVHRFRTIVTGEIYALLRDRSLLGQLAIGEAEPGSAFVEAVRVGYHSATPLADLFTLRGRCLLGDLAQEHVASSLSGFLIGAELREAMTALGPFASPVRLIGGNAVAPFYAEAMAATAIDYRQETGDLAERGFARVAACLPRTGDSPSSIRSTAV